METVHTYNVQAMASGNTQVFARFSPKISTFQLLFSLWRVLYPVSSQINILHMVSFPTVPKLLQFTQFLQSEFWRIAASVVQ